MTLRGGGVQIFLRKVQINSRVESPSTHTHPPLKIVSRGKLDTHQVFPHFLSFEEWLEFHWFLASPEG